MRSLPVATLIIGILMGAIAGTAWSRARRGWTDYQTTKTAVPKMRSTAWVLTRAAASRAGIVTAPVVAAAVWAAISPE